MQVSRKEVLEKVRTSVNDTGSIQVQVLALSDKIDALSDHLKSHHKDNSSKRGLMVLLGKRKRFLNYLKKEQHASYEDVLKAIKGKSLIGAQ